MDLANYVISILISLVVGPVGFMLENGILTKRTTARKFYMMLPKAQLGDESRFGTVVFFDNLKHVGIVDTKSTFYHAQLSRGTNRSEFDPFWRPRICGFRRMPAP